MYLIILGLIPVFEILARVHRHLPLVASFFLWLLVQFFGLHFQGNPWTGEGWFLNPFAWQFCFMLGYSFVLGRLSTPKWKQPFLLALSVFFLLLGLFFSLQTLVDLSPELVIFQKIILPPEAKTNLVAVRMVHFLCLAYVVLSFLNPYRSHLDKGIGGIFIRIGRQSLATFVMSIIAAELAGFVLMGFGTGIFVTAIINLFGFLTLVFTAEIMAFVKREPWDKASFKGRITNTISHPK